jgi:hypothetical protein
MAVAWVAECVAVREAIYLNYPDELVRAVGLVVLYAAWAEDKAGELISLHHGIHEATPHRDWAASGERLCKALEAVSSPDLAERLKRALDARHHVIHGVFLWSSNEVGGHTMKRQLGRSDPASFEMGDGRCVRYTNWSKRSK